MRKAKEYTIEQFPKNKEQSALSTEQAALRKRAKTAVSNGLEKQCSCCQRVLPITEYYRVHRNDDRRIAMCRDCKLQRQGVVELGKQRFANAIGKKGFRRCHVCKEILPLISFTPSRTKPKGYEHVCQSCNTIKSRQLLQSHRSVIDDVYLRRYGRQKYGLTSLGEADMDRLRAEIEAKRQPKFRLDGKEFVTQIQFAQYVFDTYGIPTDRTRKRLLTGYSEADCLLTTTEMHRRTKAMGEVIVTDTVTGEVNRYTQSTDPRLRALFGKGTITRAIQTGEPTRVTSRSKYRHPCTIERVRQSDGNG